MSEIMDNFTHAPISEKTGVDLDLRNAPVWTPGHARKCYFGCELSGVAFSA